MNIEHITYHKLLLSLLLSQICGYLRFLLTAFVKTNIVILTDIFTAATFEKRFLQFYMSEYYKVPTPIENNFIYSQIFTTKKKNVSKTIFFLSFTVT